MCSCWVGQVYTDLRKESAISHGMPIAVRHLESMIRMSEAHAAMHLREYVNDQDIDMAIKCARPLCVQQKQRKRGLHVCPANNILTSVWLVLCKHLSKLRSARPRTLRPPRER